MLFGADVSRRNKDIYDDCSFIQHNYVLGLHRGCSIGRALDSGLRDSGFNSQPRKVILRNDLGKVVNLPLLR